MSGRYNRPSDTDLYEDYNDGFQTDKKGRINPSGRRDDYDDEERERPKKRGGKIFAFIIGLLLICAVVVVCMTWVFIESVVDKINCEPVDAAYNRDSLFGDKLDLYSDLDVKNILICGIDGESSEYGRSDSMILLSIDEEHKKIKMSSFLRDTYVNIPDPEGEYYSKLTNAYSFGSVGLVMRTIEYNFGVKIDNYITVNFDTFKTIVDVLGGIELDLTDREILYINSQVAQNNQSDYLDAKEGVVSLNGQQALWHARNRGGYVNGIEFYEDTDWDRTRRQRDFIKAVIGETADASVFELANIASEVAGNLTTDMTKGELKSLLLNCFWYRNYDVCEMSLPTENTWCYEDNESGNVIAVYDWQQVRDELKTFICE